MFFASFIFVGNNPVLSGGDSTKKFSSSGSKSKEVIRPKISPREQQMRPPVLTTDGNSSVLMHLKAVL